MGMSLESFEIIGMPERAVSINMAETGTTVPVENPTHTDDHEPLVVIPAIILGVALIGVAGHKFMTHKSRWPDTIRNWFVDK